MWMVSIRGEGGKYLVLASSFASYLFINTNTLRKHLLPELDLKLPAGRNNKLFLDPDWSVLIHRRFSLKESGLGQTISRQSISRQL